MLVQDLAISQSSHADGRVHLISTDRCAQSLESSLTSISLCFIQRLLAHMVQGCPGMPALLLQSLPPALGVTLLHLVSSLRACPGTMHVLGEIFRAQPHIVAVRASQVNVDK